MRISVHYTRAKAEVDPSEAKNPAATNGHSDPQHRLPFPGLQLKPGRPKLAKILGSLCLRTESLRSPCGIAVCVCGPVGLAEDVAKTARGVDGYRANAVGGIEVHEE